MINRMIEDMELLKTEYEFLLKLFTSIASTPPKILEILRLKYSIYSVEISQLKNKGIQEPSQYACECCWAIPKENEMNEELKGCPFCGKIPDIEFLDRGSSLDNKWIVRCRNDDCLLRPIPTRDYDDKESAKYCWNTRMENKNER